MPTPPLTQLKPAQLDNELRRLVTASGRAKRAIAKEAHISYFTFYRWITERSAKSINVDAAERLYQVLTGERLLK
jgi:transposase